MSSIASHKEELSQDTTTSLYIVDLLDLTKTHEDQRWVQTGRILKAAVDGTSLEELITGQGMPDSIALSPEEGRLYWTCMGVPGAQDGSVWSATTCGDSIRNTLSAGVLNTPKKIAIDALGRKLYICDREGLRIVRCNLDGSGLEDLVLTGDANDASHRRDQTRWCVGLALHRDSGKIYWTQKGPNKGHQGRVFRANMHIPRGETVSSRSDIRCLLSGLPEPIDLDFDTTSATPYLYWTDRGEIPFGNSLNRCALSLLNDENAVLPLGNRGYSPPPWEILAQNLHEAVGLRVDLSGRRIFVTDLGGCVYCFDLDGSNKRKMYEDRGCFLGIALEHASKI